MIEKVKMLIAKVILNKYLPTTYILKGWESLRGYRTQICALAWVLCYEFGKYKAGPFADPEFTSKALEWLGGMASVTFLSKLKTWTPYLEQGIEAVKNTEVKNEASK